MRFEPTIFQLVDIGSLFHPEAVFKVNNKIFLFFQCEKNLFENVSLFIVSTQIRSKPNDPLVDSKSRLELAKDAQDVAAKQFELYSKNIPVDSSHLVQNEENYEVPLFSF